MKGYKIQSSRTSALPDPLMQAMDHRDQAFSLAILLPDHPLLGAYIIVAATKGEAILVSMLPNMDQYQRERWIRLFDQARHDLEEEQCNSVLRTSGLDDLIANLDRSATLYSRHELPRLASKIHPSLRHIESFTSAISSASQYRPVACLVWGGIQAVLQVLYHCACLLPNVLEEMFELIADLNNTLPRFESDLTLYSDREELQWPLQDLYEEYLKYCTTAVRYLRRRPERNILAYLWTSSPQQALQQTKTRIRKHIKSFDKEVQSIHRQYVRSQNLGRIRDLSLQEHEAQPYSEDHSGTSSHHTISTVFMFKNYAFTGRDDELNFLHCKFFPSHQSGPQNDVQAPGPICCVLHGLGGSGKTQTALEYTYRYREEYDAMFWVPAESDHEMAASFALIAFKLKLVEDEDQKDTERKQNQHKAIQEARNWLQRSDKQWLLIFDNVEDIRDLETYLPTETKNRGSVIVTTQRPRSRRITRSFYNIELHSFDEDQGAKLLFKYLEREPNHEAEENLARETSCIVGGLPLAIATIGGYINESESSVAEFLEIMKRSSNAWEDTQHTKVMHYERTLGTVFDIALKELPPKTRNLIEILAFLNPDSIPEGILNAPHDDDEVSFLGNKADLLEMTRILRRRQLVRRETSGEEPFLAIHRSLQWSIIVDLSRNYDQRWAKYHQAFVLLRRGMPMSSPIQVPEPEKWPNFERYTPQVLNLRTHCLWPEPPVDLPVDFAHILSDMGTYMWHAGLIDDGSEALETAENILDERKVPKINPLRSDILGNLGILSGFAGISERRDGMKRRHTALEIRKKVFDDISENKRTRDDEVRLYIAESDVAFGYAQEERFDDVEEIMERCLTQYKTWSTEEKIPYEYAKYYYTMSLVRASQKLIKEAVEFGIRGVELVTKSAGEDHSVTQLWKFSLATLYFHSGDFAQSLRIHEKVLADRRRLCGEFNGFTLESYSTCGALLLREGNAEKAAEYLDCCLERRKLASWDREGVGRARFRYHHVLKSLGKIDEARTELERAHTIRDQVKIECGDYLSEPDPSNELAIFDQMCSMWAGRFTGKIMQDSTPSLDFTNTPG
ncbi:MAG: hypothetical protein Q9163_001286 [Psora crenata]